MPHTFAVLAAGKVTTSRLGRENFTGSGYFEALSNGFLSFTTGDGSGHNNYLVPLKAGAGSMRAISVFRGRIVRFLFLGGFILMGELAHPFTSGEW